MKCMDEYFIKTKNEILAKKILPIILLFFHQRNISQIKTYSKEDIVTLIIDELNEGIKISKLKSYAKSLAFSQSVTNNIRMMGFKLKGRLLVRVIMGLSALKQYKLATKIILLK